MTIKKNIISHLSMLFIITSFTFFSQTTSAYEEDKKTECKPPRLRRIKPESYTKNHSEVPPESEFSFTLPVWTDPEKVTVTVKKIPTKVTVEDHGSFFLVKGNLPAELENTYARVSVRAVAKLGCLKRDGWLLKISERIVANPEPEKEPEPESKPENSSEKQQPAKAQ